MRNPKKHKTVCQQIALCFLRFHVLRFFVNKCIYCNCNYILFTKLPRPGDSEGTFRSSSQAATCPPVYHTWWRLLTVSFFSERQAGKLLIPIFIVFGLTRSGIEPEFTVSVADALSTRTLKFYTH